MEEAATEGLSGFDRRKVAKRKFLCSNVQSLKVLSTKISGVLMFSKDYDVHRVQSLEERLHSFGN